MTVPTARLWSPSGWRSELTAGPHIELMPLWMLKASDEQYAWAKAHQGVITAAVVDAVMDEWTRRIKARIRAGERVSSGQRGRTN